MPPKGNDTPPPSPLRSQRLMEISPSPGGGRAGEETDHSSSFAVDAADGGGDGIRTRPPLVLGPVVVPDLSAAEDGGNGDGATTNVNCGDGGATNDDVGVQPQRERQFSRPASVAANAAPASSRPLGALSAAAVTDDDGDDHPQHRDESLPCPTAFPRAAKARRTAHPASPPAGDIFRRIREAEDYDRDDDGDDEEEEDDDDGSLDEVCLDMGLRMEMEPHGERLTRSKDEGEAPTNEQVGAKASGLKSVSDEGPMWSTSNAETPPPHHLRRALACSTPRRSSLKKVSTSVSYVSSSTMTVARRQRISFSSLEIRPYSVTLGDHPCCSSGPPLSLGWDYDESAVVSVQVEDYESSRTERRTRREMRMGCEARRERLLDSGSGSTNGDSGSTDGDAHGMTERDLRRAERKVYRERSRTRPVHQARKATGFFFSSPPLPPPSGSNVVVVRATPGTLRGMQE